jgi:hypothetical protein
LIEKFVARVCGCIATFFHFKKVGDGYVFELTGQHAVDPCFAVSRDELPHGQIPQRARYSAAAPRRAELGRQC